MRYCNIFKKEGDDFDRYWLSISTAKLDKKGEPTGDYARTSMTVRMSNDMKEVFDKNSVKTKTKGITTGCFEIKECRLEAVEPKEGDPFAVIFVWKMVPEDD